MPGTATPIAISAGGFHTLVLMDDGTVAAFGQNSEGQLGNGGVGNGPVAVSTLTDVIAVAAGGYHSLALKNDGTVWAWGISTNGQLGTGTFMETTPVQVASGVLTDVVAIGAGSFASYAVKSDGTAWAWGANASGQLGDGSGVDQAAPVAVASLTGVAAIAGGWDHAAALKSDGTVWCWGSNWSGQLGDWYFGGSATPIQAVGVSGAVAIATGSDHTLAKLSDGSMWAWGGNFNGQLATGDAWVSTLNFDPLPTQLDAGVVQVSAGGYTSFALKSDGTISGFGYVEYGQMGDGLYQGKPFPVQAYGLKEGGVSGAGGRFHAAIVLSDGTVGWVGQYDTQNLYIGGMDPDDQRYELKVLTLADDAVSVSSGDQHTLALLANGTVWAWGVNANGELGDGTNTTSMTPVQVSGLTNVISIAADASTSVAVKSDGTVWAWGSNATGQLADGTTTPSNVPVQIVATGLANITKVAVGGDHVIARKNDGTVWAWGNNDMGQLVGGGSTVLLPTQISGLTNVSEIAAGTGFSLALRTNGTVSSWGFNDYGQLGLGDTTLRTTPVVVPGLVGVAQVTTGTAHSLVRLQDGTLRAWGNNELGQLGDGTFINRVSPVAVWRVKAVQSVAAGFLHSLAVRSDGSVWTWGNNGNEQLAVSVRHEHRPAIRLIVDLADTGQLGVTNAWLMEHFGTLQHDVTNDSDQDGWSDIQEFLMGTNPNRADSDGDGLDDIADQSPFLDSDGDGLPDDWEILHFGNLSRDGSDDWNGDGLLDRDAFRYGLDPKGADESEVTGQFDSFHYDERDWLDGFSLTGSASFSFGLDDEGNIETAN